ncbi:MAG: capsule biosynthesis protein, partial [Planctomycetes bacterium]|nr:capsule biosynthesis protein [Planctomycetota bacterium]
MTTKPKARRYRIRRSEPLAQSPSDANTGDEAPAHASEDVTAPVGPTATGSEAATEAQAALDAIRDEDLTGRQLRMARRVADKHGLNPASDFDAVRLLRLQGIDPFQRVNMLELVVPPGGAEEKDGATDALQSLSPDPKGRVQLPQTVPAGKRGLPSPDVTGPKRPDDGPSPSERRIEEISRIQRDIMLRRRRKLMLLMARLAFFVLLPTFVAGWYFYKVATPMYATKSEFLILKADNSGGSGLGGLLSGTQFATSQDSIAVQSYLESKDAMLRLDRDAGFEEHFSQPWIDPIQRLPEDASNEATYKVYRKRVKIGYDPTEGVLRMEVVAPDPQTSATFSRKLIGYAEERVNQLSQHKRGDQMKDALQGFETAQVARREAQEALVELQQKGAVLDPEGVIAGLRTQINSVEVQLQEKQLQLAALNDNLRPNQAKVDGAEADIRRLEHLLDDLNDRMTDASKGENSLASLSVRIQMAQADLATRDLMLQSALQQVEQTRMEANRQVRYLTTSVEPVASEDPSYPRKFENTILAFLVFSGIYLMISL